MKVRADGSHDFNMNYAGDCAENSTLQVKLNQGDGILFWGYQPEEENSEGKIDWASEHTGCLVEEGHKWIATVWFRGSRWRAKPNYGSHDLGPCEGCM